MTVNLNVWQHIKNRINANFHSDWSRRTVVGVSLVILFTTIVYFGPPLMLLTALAIQLKCLDEIITIACSLKKMTEQPHFRTLHWYFVTVANYFLYGESLAGHFRLYLTRCEVLVWLHNYHRFISFCLYFSGLMVFALTMVKRRALREQFSLLACTHFLIIIIVLQSHSCVDNLFEGMIWVIYPVVIVTLNDIFAYVFGRLLGRTPLIQVSPKKTMEGFFYGALATFVTGYLVAILLSPYQHIVCPVKYIEDNSGSIILDTNCKPGYFFQEQDYSLGLWSFRTYPFVVHSTVFSFFASIVAPFGGFFASAFKRAFNVKDFSDIIPGHGGIMDRSDCQYLMSTFINVYIFTFVRVPNIDKVLARVLYLTDDKQVEFYRLLGGALKNQGLLQNNGTYLL